MENRFGAPASGTPEGSARREFELLLLLGGSRKAAVQLWLRKQRIYANAQQAAGRPATEAKGSRGAAERQAGGESKPETAAQAARRHRSEHRLREKHLPPLHLLPRLALEGGHGLPAQLLRGRRHLALRVIPRRLPTRPLVAPPG